jgi:hypothetical protein
MPLQVRPGRFSVGTVGKGGVFVALSTKNQGELFVGIGAIVLLVGLGFLGFTLGIELPRHQAMRQQGKVVEAAVTDLREVTSGSRRSRSTSYQVTVTFAAKAGRPYSEDGAAAPAGQVKSSNPIDNLNLPFLKKTAKHRASGAGDTAAKLSQVSYPLYSKLGLGSSIDVVYPSYVVELDTFRRHSSLPMGLAGLLIGTVGGGMVAFGRRKMKAAA